MALPVWCTPYRCVAAAPAGPAARATRIPWHPDVCMGRRLPPARAAPADASGAGRRGGATAAAAAQPAPAAAAGTGGRPARPEAVAPREREARPARQAAAAARPAPPSGAVRLVGCGGVGRQQHHRAGAQPAPPGQADTAARAARAARATCVRRLRGRRYRRLDAEWRHLVRHHRRQPRLRGGETATRPSQGNRRGGPDDHGAHEGNAVGRRQHLVPRRHRLARDRRVNRTCPRSTRAARCAC